VEHFSSILLDLYRLARSTAAPRFKDAALAAIKQRLPFDAAMWGTFVAAPHIVVHSFHLQNLPARKMEDYEGVKDHDPLNRRGIAKPGRTTMTTLAEMKGKLHPSMVAYVRRYDLESVLSTVWLDEGLKIYTAISIYRGRARPAFTERERKLKQALIPHLVDAWNTNAIQHLDERANSSAERQLARAKTDGKGMIYNAEPGFAELMREEFPGWTGPRIPGSVLAPLSAARGEAYRGDAIQAATLRHIGDGTMLIAIRRLGGLDRLSPRELAVAREYAAGRTYKEIAHALGVAPATVRNQLRSAYVKLGVATKIALAKCLDGPG
jgi:DNA-binding CsgD family transcriptional regulator